LRVYIYQTKCIPLFLVESLVIFLLFSIDIMLEVKYIVQTSMSTNFEYGRGEAWKDDERKVIEL